MSDVQVLLWICVFLWICDSLARSILHGHDHLYLCVSRDFLAPSRYWVICIPNSLGMVTTQFGGGKLRNL